MMVISTSLRKEKPASIVGVQFFMISPYVNIVKKKGLINCRDKYIYSQQPLAPYIKMIYCKTPFSVFTSTSVNIFLLEGEMPGQSSWCLPRLLLLPGRGMDIFTDNQHGIHYKNNNYELKQRVTRESARIRI
jgi:hypothetical protein